MKKLLIFVMALLFTATAFAQTDPVAYIIGAETQSANTTPPITVESVLVQLNDDVDYTNYGTDPGQWEWADVAGDFSVLDGTTVLDVYTIESNHTDPTLGLDGDNYFVLTFELSGNYGPAVDYLELYYLRGSTLIPTDSYGNLQTTTTAQEINDGIKPVLTDYVISSGFAGNAYFAEAGSVITLDFESNEPLASIPVSPTVTFSVAEADYSETVSSVLNPDNLNWRATFTVPATPALNGKVNFTINFRDLRDNQNVLGPVDEDNYGNSVWLKNYDPAFTYAGTAFDATTLPTHFGADTDDLIYLWNVFNTIQEAVDAVVVDGDVVVCSAVTENPTIDKGLTIQSEEAPVDYGYVVTGDFTVTSDDVTFDNMNILPASIGITFDSSAGVLDNLNVINSIFDLASGGGIGILIGGYTTPQGITNITMDENIFYGPTSKVSNPWKIGGYSGTDVYCDVTNLVFSDNTVNYGSIPINFFDNNLTNFDITGNTFVNTDGGIYIWDTSGSASAAGTFDDFYFYDNDLSTGNSYGIGIGGAPWGDPDYATTDFTNFVVIDNDFSGIAGAYGYDAVSIFFDTPVDVTALTIDAIDNWWGDETGPYNATYNPQGLGSAVSDDVWFSTWYTDAGMTTDGSSEIAIQGAINGTSVSISNVLSNTDGTISMDVTTDYPTFDVNLPHELLTDALLTSDVAFNDAAYIKIEGWGQTFDSIDIDGTEAWLSDLLLAATPAAPSVRNPLYLDFDNAMTITFYNLDTQSRDLDIEIITARTGDFDFLNTYEEVTAECTLNNDYRGIENGDSGYELAETSVTIQDPIQYVLDGSSFVYNDDLAIDVFDEMTFSYTATYPVAPTTPALNSNWLWDIKFVVSDNLPSGTVIEWTEETLALDLSNDNEFWLSELLAGSTPFGQNALVAELIGGTRDFSFILTGLDDSIYNIDASLIVSDFSDVSQGEYTIGQADFDFQDPIQVAVEQTVVTLQNLTNSTDGYVSFDVDVNYPAWTTIPELPAELKVDAIIVDAYDAGLGEVESYQPLPNGTEIDVYYNGNFVDTYAPDGTNPVYLSDIISTPDRPALKDDSDGVWTLNVKHLDAEIHNLTFATVAAGTANFVPFSDDENGFYSLGWTLPDFGTAPDITFQDPMQVALGTTLTLSELDINAEDELSFTATVDYPVFTNQPAMSSDWLTDAWLDLGVDQLPTEATVDVTYNSAPVATGYDVGEESGIWLSTILGGAAFRAPLIGHDDLTDVWGITLHGLDSSEYTLNMYSVTAASANFVDPTLADVSLDQYVLAEDDITFIDPIEYAEDNSTVDIDIIEDINAEAGIQFDVDVQYASLPTIPYVPESPYTELYVDALIVCYDADGNTLTDFPSGNSVEVTRIVDGTSYTWPTSKTFPTGENHVWLSELLDPTAMTFPYYRNLLSYVDGDLEEWHFDVDGMDYNNYGFGVIIVTAENNLGFDEFETVAFDPIDPVVDHEEWIMYPWYVLGFDAVWNVQIPYFTSLEIEVSEDGTSWGEPYADSWDDATLTFDATLEMDVDVPEYYLNIQSAGTNTDLALGYHPFYIDTTQYPAAHPLGFNGAPGDDVMTEHDYTFLEYWESKGVYDGCSGTWEPLMWQIIDGQLPFFYVKVSEDLTETGGQTLELIDGLHHQLGMDEYMQLPGDYFLGDYVFTGYIYSKAHDGNVPADANGVDELRSDLITVNITVQDIVGTTYPEFDPLELQDQVQNSNYWIDLEKNMWVDADIFTMYLNSDVDYYELNIDNEEMMTNYNFAPQYQPFYMVPPDLTGMADFWTYWDAKGVNAGAIGSGDWQELMWYIINGQLPMFYIDIADDQTMTLIDGLLFAAEHLAPTEEDAAFRINGEYPLGTYQVTGDLVGINGTMYENLDIYLEMLKSEVVDYDLIIWEDYATEIQITEHAGATDEDINMVVDEPYDITVNAIDVNKIIVSDYSDETILFGSNYDAYVQMTNWTVLQSGTVYVENAIRTLHEISDPMLYISVTGELFDSIVSPNGGYIVEEADVVILPPDCFEVYDVVPDQGGFVYFEICRSPNDPFYIEPGIGGLPAQEPYIDHYTIERYSEPGDTVGGAWEWFESIDCYDNQSNLIVTGPKATIGSDDEYEYKVTAVYVPNSDETQTKVARVKEEGPTDEGAQSPWLLAGSPAAAADNIPAYANFTVYLEGPYVGSGVMQDGQTKPLTSPYDGETITALPLPSDQIIDWVQIQLRETATGTTVKQANAFLLTDGSIVDVDGNYSLPFYYTTGEEYYIVIHHRNHLDIMTAAAWEFSDSPITDSVIDLSVAGSVYGDGFNEVETDIYAMYSGDGNNSNLVNSADALTILNNLNLTTYNDGDLNLSGLTNSADALEVLNNINTAGSVPDPGTDVLATRTRSTGNRAGEDCTLEITNVVVVPSVSYSFDVYITRNASWTTNTALGSLFGSFPSTAVMNVTNNAFANPVISNLGSCITSVNETLFSNKLQVELVSSGTAVSTTAELLFSVEMDIANPSTTAGLSWNDTDTVIYDDTNFAAKTVELIGGDNSTLPVVLSSFTADYVAQFDHVELNWSTASEDGNAGWNLYRGENEDAMVNGEVMLLNQGLIPGAGTTTEPTYYDFIDDNALVSGQEYWYWLESVDQGGEVHIYDPVTMMMPVGTTPELPSVTMLKGNYPNPFNPATEIAYSIKQGETGVLSIYNAKGQRVHTTELQAGNGSYRWEATQQASGIYFYRLKTDSYNDIKKMMLLK